VRAYLVVNVFVEVFDEDITLPSLPQMRVTLGPHDAAEVISDTERSNCREILTKHGF
jgi:hypothetical protein